MFKSFHLCLFLKVGRYPILRRLMLSLPILVVGLVHQTYDTPSDEMLFS